MIRRLVACVGVALGMLAATTAPAWASQQSNHDDDWACVFVTQINKGYCQQNPLPQELPDLP
jgi:hypothetical protein